MSIFYIFFMILVLAVPAQADLYNCVSPAEAEKAKRLIENKGFMIEFCSNCEPESSPIRRINVSEVILKENSCGTEIFVKGRLARQVKPPVFTGHGKCPIYLEIGVSSVKLAGFFDQQIDLAYYYTWDSQEKKFLTLAEQVGLSTELICIPGVKFKN
ncbi:MAG: hypothetical protein SFT81_07790 [Candidatus Caenarcaniphilales bacterium]|nr:hypothetical protein [Candidatus Caenarcaniphilales bacterium]